MKAIVAAVSLNNIIGRKNFYFDQGLLWNVKDDLRIFKNLTLHSTVVMGKTTYKTIGRPLKNRQNLILSSRPFLVPAYSSSCWVYSDLSFLLSKHKDEDLFFIGGAKVFAQVLPIVDVLFISRIEANILGDVFFPDFDIAEYQLFLRYKFEKNERNEYPFTFQVFVKKNISEDRVKKIMQLAENAAKGVNK